MHTTANTNDEVMLKQRLQGLYAHICYEYKCTNLIEQYIGDYHQNEIFPTGQHPSLTYAQVSKPDAQTPREKSAES